MAAQTHDDPDDDAPLSSTISDEQKMAETQSAVERSLEDFIARANSTLPAPAPAVVPAVRGITARRQEKSKAAARHRAKGTLVVVGSQAPLAEETEIVSRLPAEDLLPPRGRSWSTLKLAAAFLAGAAIVLIATRLISGGPRPVKPTAPVVAPAAPVVSAPPPIIVVPIPTPPEPPPAAAAVESAPPVPAVSEAKRPPPAPRKPRPPAPAKPATEAKKSGSLVDPFAN